MFIPTIPIGSPLLTTTKLDAIHASTRANEGRVATRRGALRATAISLMIVVIGYSSVWILFPVSSMERIGDLPDAIRNIAFACGIVSFAISFAAREWPHYSRLAAPVVALSGGIFCGGVALALELRHPGIAMQSIIVTSIVCLALLVGYSQGWIDVSRRFRAVVMLATAAVAVIYLLSFSLWLVDIHLPVIHDAGWGGIGWSAFVSIVASLNLVVDFYRLHTLEDRPSASFMEWYVALGTVTTFVWLYISILRLLQRIRN
jgi:uncharacterized YccA/Bax inhibitor family protein